MEVFIDDFSVYGKTFEDCLANLDKVLNKCHEVNLVPNWDRCHFMAREGIILGDKVSEMGIKLDKVKIEVIEELPPPTNDYFKDDTLLKVSITNPWYVNIVNYIVVGCIPLGANKKKII
jgi:hypothetical protein